MGYRYGERKYSEGLYSRWPDWWRDKTCAHEQWTAQACAPALWTVIVPPPPGPIPPWTEASLMARPRHVRP